MLRWAGAEPSSHDCQQVPVGFKKGSHDDDASDGMKKFLVFIFLTGRAYSQTLIFFNIFIVEWSVLMSPVIRIDSWPDNLALLLFFQDFVSLSLDSLLLAIVIA